MHEFCTAMRRRKYCRAYVPREPNPTWDPFTHFAQQDHGGSAREDSDREGQVRRVGGARGTEHVKQIRHHTEWFRPRYRDKSSGGLRTMGFSPLWSACHNLSWLAAGPLTSKSSTYTDKISFHLGNQKDEGCSGRASPPQAQTASVRCRSQ